MITTTPLLSWTGLNKWKITALGAALLLQLNSFSQSTELITTVHSAHSGHAGNGNSGGPSVTSNGQFVLFQSAATDLVTNRVTGLAADLYLRDRVSGATRLVSVDSSGATGANNAVGLGEMSNDGRFVVFDSFASNLAPGDINKQNNVFLRDMASGTTYLVSHRYDSATNSGHGDSSNPVLATEGGLFIAFQSTAPDLVSNVFEPETDIFLYDRQSRANLLLSRGPDPRFRAHCENPVITPDGKFVAFTGAYTNLMTGQAIAGREVYVYDREQSKLLWVSAGVSALGQKLATGTNFDSFLPALSDDGTSVVFQAWNFNPTNALATNASVFLTLRYDLKTANIEVIQSGDGNSGFLFSNPLVAGPSLSTEGKLVLYCMSSNLYLWDAATRSNAIINLDSTGSKPASGTFEAAMISSDGRTVSFLSDATNLVSNADLPEGPFQIYIRDLVRGITSIASTNGLGIPLNDVYFSYPILSANGQFLAFESAEEEIVPNDGNGAFDAFIHNNQSGALELISEADARATSATASGYSSLSPNAISADGRFLVFISNAPDLTTNSNTSQFNIYVYDFETKKTVLASVGQDGVSGADVACADPLISADGRFVAFMSPAGNLVPNDTNGLPDIFARDLQKGVTTLVSVESSGQTSANGSSTLPTMSADGQMIVFQSSASNLVSQIVEGATTHSFVRDLKGQKTLLISTNLAGTVPAPGPTPPINSDGTWVLFVIHNFTFHFFARNLVTGEILELPPVFAPTAGLNSFRPMAFAGGGRFAVYPIPVTGSNAIAYSLFDLETRGFETICTNCANVSTSFDGRFAVYATVPNNAGGPPQIYLLDRVSHNYSLISTPDGVTPGNGSSSFPQISSNGRVITFESKATNLGTDTNNFNDIYMLDRVSGELWLVSGANGGRLSGNLVSGNASVSLTNGIIAFQSYSDNLVARDRNNASDVFVWHFPTPDFDLATDSDADGLPDAWEMQYFGNLSQNAWDDPDRDGVSNLDEFRFGTSPLVSSSPLRILGVNVIGTSFRISWAAAAGKRYQVQYTDDLSRANWITLAGDVTGTGATAEKIDNSLTNAHRFYRVTLVP